jgi:hypothetical protein
MSLLLGAENKYECAKSVIDQPFLTGLTALI